MSKAVMSLSINNGDDLLTLKEVIYKNSDKDDGDEQKHSDSKQTNDKTSSLEPNLQLDSDANCFIIDSICTQEERESENVDVSNDSSDEDNANNDDEDNQTVSIDGSGSSYSSSHIEEEERSVSSDGLEDEDSENKHIMSLSTSYSNIFSRLPLNHKQLEDTSDDDNLQYQAKKRKLEVSPRHEYLRANKIKKVWDIIKYPFQKTTAETSMVCEVENITSTKTENSNKSCSIM